MTPYHGWTGDPLDGPALIVHRTRESVGAPADVTEVVVVTREEWERRAAHTAYLERLRDTLWRESASEGVA